MKVHFGFIFLLALRAIVDSHVKLRHANMEIKSHKKALTEIMIFRKIRLAALEELFTSAVIPNLHFIGSPSPGVLTKNHFSQLSPVHELGEFQW
jgi:hypothetical protein